VVSEWEPVSRGSFAADLESQEALAHSQVPLVLAHGADEPFERLIVVVSRSEDLVPPGRSDLELAREVSARLARGHPVNVVAPQLGDPVTGLFEAGARAEMIRSVDPLGWVQSNAGPKDLVILPGLEEVKAALARIPELLRKHFLVTVAPTTA
jgi:hypothetical protein